MVSRLAESNRSLRTGIVICCVLFFIGLTASSYAIYDRFNQTNDKRAAQQDFNHRIAKAQQSDRDALVNLLCFTRRFTLKSSHTPAELRSIQAYYVGALAPLHASPAICSQPPQG